MFTGEKYPDVTTTAQWSVISANDLSGKFRIVESAHEDAPPTGVWTLLRKVNMIRGRLDDCDEAIKADKERNSDEFLKRYNIQNL